MNRVIFLQFFQIVGYLFGGVEALGATRARVLRLRAARQNGRQEQDGRQDESHGCYGQILRQLRHNTKTTMYN